jgi:hypothetical protein
MMVKHDGIVGDWHRWVVLSTAYTVLATYIAYIVIHFIIRTFGIDGALGFTLPADSLDWRLLLITVPWGIMRGERGYQRDLEINGPANEANLATERKEKLLG